MAEKDASVDEFWEHRHPVCKLYKQCMQDTCIPCIKKMIKKEKELFMEMNQYGFSVYKILALIFFLGLVFVLALPQFFDLQSREKTEECINNMLEVRYAAEQYMRDREQIFVGTVDDLTRTRYLRTSNIICPYQGKYSVVVDPETEQIHVECFNVSVHPDHILHSE